MARSPAWTETDFLMLTSANGVEAFFARLRAAGQDLRALKGVTVVAVGPKTATAVEALGLRPDLVPDEYRAEGVVALLAEQNLAGQAGPLSPGRTGPRRDSRGNSPPAAPPSPPRSPTGPCLRQTGPSGSAGFSKRESTP